MRDDHSKNFAFCMDASGRWALSPAFDLCPNPGPAGWHTMTVSGVGVDITRADLLRFADKLDLPEAIAKDGIAQALAAASEFESLAVSLGAQKTGAKAWAKAFSSIAKRLAPATVAASSRSTAKPTSRVRSTPRRIV